MDTKEIIYLLEKPSSNIWSFVYQIRDEAAVSDIVAALHASTVAHTRALLCYILNLRSRAEFFAGQTSETKQAVPALVETLADADGEVRSSAIDALGHIGDPLAGPALLDMYHKEHDDSDLRISLASALGFCQYTSAIPTLIAALSSPHSLLRGQATWGLRHLRASEASEPLRQALLHEHDPRTRHLMQAALQEFDHPSAREEKAERLLAQLRSVETDEREAAAEALGDLMDKQTLAPLLALLHHERGEVRQSAAFALDSLGAYRDADWFVRIHRAQVQGPLIQALTDQESPVRAMAAQALGQWGDPRAVEPLLAALQDTSAEVRRQVAATLSYPKDVRVLEPLLNAFLTDNDLQVRNHAAEGLGKYLEDERAVNPLIQALQDEHNNVRQQAAESLCWLKDERAVDALLHALQDTDHEVREWSVAALWEICLRIRGL